MGGQKYPPVSAMYEKNLVFTLPKKLKLLSQLGTLGLVKMLFTDCPKRLLI